MLFKRGMVTVTVIFGLFTFCLSFTIGNSEELYEDDACQLSDGSSGTCTIDIKCSWFMRNRKKIQPSAIKRCGFSGTNAIICCPAAVDGTRLAAQTERRAVLACRNAPYATRLSEHIIEGTEADEGEIAFIAALGYASSESGQDYDWRCGSSLISKRFILTAAHCLRPDRPIVARMGALNLKDPGSDYQDSKLKSFFPHPMYKGPSKYHDIALIGLETPFEYSDYVKSACLHTALDDLPKSHVLTASGWGLTDTDQPRSDILLKVDLETEPVKECDEKIRHHTGGGHKNLRAGVTNQQYCAIGRLNAANDKRGDSCQGDSGGPLHYTNQKEDRFYLLGITSVGVGCGATASVYTRVAAYLDWIEPIVWPDDASLKE